jgi:uncharacterized protein (DUF697 family)
VNAEEYRVEAEQIVGRHMLMALAVGLVPVPVADVAALIAIQLRMLARLSNLYQIEFSEEVGRSLLASLLGASGSFLATATTRRLLFRLVPIGGWVAGAVSASALAGASTYAVGKVFVQHFESGGTFQTFDPDVAREYYEQQLEEGSAEVAKGFGTPTP